MDMQSSKISFTGLALGAIALLLAVVHFWAGPFTVQPTLQQTVAERAVSFKEAAKAALQGEEVKVPEKPQKMDWDQQLNLLTAVLGSVAVILGVVGYATKEPLRVAGGAVLLGGGAVAFQFAVVALSAILVAILVAAVLPQLGID